MTEQLSPDVVFSFDPEVQAQIRARDAVAATNMQHKVAVTKNPYLQATKKYAQDMKEYGKNVAGQALTGTRQLFRKPTMPKAMDFPLKAAPRQVTAAGKGPLNRIPSLGGQPGQSLRTDLEGFRSLGRYATSNRLPTDLTFGAGQKLSKGLLTMNKVFSTPASGGVSNKAMIGNVKRAANLGMSKLFKMGSTLGTVGSRMMKALGVPSMAEGGIVDAPKRTGKLVNLHKGELVIPARKVASVRKALRKSGVTVPLRRR